MDFGCMSLLQYELKIFATVGLGVSDFGYVRPAYSNKIGKLL